MAFHVEIQDQAQADLDAIFERVILHAPFRGPLWFERLEAAIWSLRLYPERFPVDAKLKHEGQEVRKLAFGKRANKVRIYYSIIGETVHVLHVRHGRRDEPTHL